MNEPKFDSDVEKNAHSRDPNVNPAQFDEATARFPTMHPSMQPYATPPPMRTSSSSSRPPSAPSFPPTYQTALPTFQAAPSLMQTGVHTAARTPSALDEIRQESWVRRRIGFACAAFGLAIIVGVLGFSFFKLATQTFPEAPEHLALAVSVVIAEAAITIAGLFVGYSMLTVAERLIVDKRVLGVAMAARATKDQPRSTLPEMRGRMPSYSGMAPMSTDTQRQ